MRSLNFLLGLTWAIGVYARYNQHIAKGFLANGRGAPVDEISLPLGSGGGLKMSHNKINRRDTYPINCHLHNWTSASVESIKEAYSWFYQLWAPLEADAQHCRRVACFGASAVWLCADSLDYQKPNSVKIADKMNDLLDGDNGCLDEGDTSMVQGQVFTTEEWSVLVRGGEDCSVEPPQQPIFY
ncbi:hypothetical protein F5Y07DRAFT_366562 [Xylaria sp. FL0933]|nr:hypothetical protein F5Y07DRAFT_366562 [Xylaria sp. FL0933]